MDSKYLHGLVALVVAVLFLQVAVESTSIAARHDREITFSSVDEDLFEVQTYDYISPSSVLKSSKRNLARILVSDPTTYCKTMKDCSKLGFVTPKCCGNRCLDVSKDDRHCGDCNGPKTCCDLKNGYKCTKGVCKRGPPAPSCATKQNCADKKALCCDKKCVDAQTNAKHCGRCYKQCDWRWRTCCKGSCKNLMWDSGNCGECGKCCTKGGCCHGKCRDFKNDCNHCGRCDHKCDWGKTCCDGRCVDIRTNYKHCGKCYRKCQPNHSCKYGLCNYGM